MNPVSPAEIISAIRRVTGPGAAPLHEPVFAGREWQYVKDCLDSTYVSSVGAEVGRFEAELADLTGANHAVAVVNGTAALHVALLLAGVRAGDEVLVPALTFVATANAVAYCGAIPHFVDSESRTLGVDPAALRDYLASTTELRNGIRTNRQTGRPLRALVPMHTFGHPADLDGLLALSRDFGLALVEDAAESLGSTYRGRHTGTFGMLGTLSFNGNKTVTTGGGGAILTNDIELARRARHITTTAKVPHRWEYRHDETGFNYRMPNLNAALGRAQLEQLPRFVDAKRTLYRRYADAFADISGATMFVEPADCRSNYWLQTLVLSDVLAPRRDEILAATNDAGLMTRPAWQLLNELPPYADCPSMPLPAAQALVRRIINLPSGARYCLEAAT